VTIPLGPARETGAQGPFQPIAFSHTLRAGDDHAQKRGPLDCVVCHH